MNPSIMDTPSTWFLPWNNNGTAKKTATMKNDGAAGDDDGDPPAPWMTVYYFPHAGGSADSALSWWTTTTQQQQDTYPYTIQIVSIPGRGRRLEEDAMTDLDELAKAIAQAIQTECQTPACILWGHSFGSLLASKVAVRLSRPPSLLLVSAHPFGNEGLKQKAFYETLHYNNDDDPTLLLTAIEQFGLLGAKDRELILQTDEEAREFILAPLKRDLAMAEQFQVHDMTDIPVIVMGGIDDPWCSVEEMERSWKKYSSKCQTPSLAFPGGHFYFLDQQDGSVQKSVEEVIQSVMVEEFKWDPARENTKLSILSGPRVDYPPHQYRPVHELVERQALETPDRVAIEEGSMTWTFQQARREAHGLVRLLNLQPGDCVGVALPHCADYILVNWAIFLAGGAIVPMDVGRTGSTVLPLVPPLPVACIVTTEAHAGRIRDTDCRVIQLNRNENDGDSWVDQIKEMSLVPPSDLPNVSLDDLAYVTTTSGTTGKPKVVRNNHRGAAICFLAREYVLPYDDADDYREGMNLFFVWECLRPLMFGRTAVVIPDTTVFDPRAFTAFLKRTRIHRLMINSALMTNLLDQFEPEARDDKSIRTLGEVKHIFLEGEVVPSHMVRSWNQLFPQISVWNIYSTWESLDVSMCNLTELFKADDVSGPAPVGTILPNVMAYIVDSHRRIVPKGIAGELLVAGPGVSLGYGDVEQTALKFLPNPFNFGGGGNEEKKEVDSCDNVDSMYSIVYKTGDRAIAGDIYTTIKGRIDSQMVKIRAFKVSLNWVEEAILRTTSFSRVSAAVVVPQLDSTTQQPIALAAYLVFGHKSDAERETATRQIHECLIESLPEYAVPTFYVPLTKLPIKEGSGRKLDKAALPDPVEHAVDLRLQSSIKREANFGHTKSKAAELILGAMQTILENKEIDVNDNFFSNGGHSLRAAGLVNALTRNFGMKFTVIDVYNNPTANELATLCNGSSERRKRQRERPERSRSGDAGDIAIIGMEGRFPGAMSVDELWQNVLLKGETTVREISKEELKARGVPQNVYNDPSWVAKAYAMKDVDKFDASFWGISKEEASMMDPQHRVFLEIAWAAMENAGYAPRSGTPERTGVFAACGIDGYLYHHLRGGGLGEPLDPGSAFLTEIGNEKDYISSRVAFGLDLLGPSITVTSACSSGLAAIIQGANSLASMETDMVLAGASSITFPNFGYLFAEGLVTSPDGIVRPFDEKANGTVFGDSVGCVVLKRLQDAERDGDNVMAVLKGWGQSNDGRQKAGFAAPSAYGQSLAIEDALRMSKIDPLSISYIECHATATEIGDGVEIMGILEAYKRLGRSPKSTIAGQRKLSALGSIKGNIGHANAAAGITGFIKTVLMLKERTLVPTANLQKVSSEIDHAIARSPFYIYAAKSPRSFSVSHPQQQLRAGVSSFGIGGANAHCVLEGYHKLDRKGSPQNKSAWKFGRLHLLNLSATSQESLKETIKKYADYLGREDAKNISPGTIAYTTQVAREHFTYRYSCPFWGAEDARNQLQKTTDKEVGCRRIVASKSPRTVAFVFPGQGSQYLNMGRDLFQTNPFFRRIMKRCSDIARPLINFDLLEDYLYGTAKDEIIAATATALQISLFAVEFSMAQLLLAAGLQPVAVCGHSLGEITAATVAGVLDLEDAIKLIAVRSEACDKSDVKGSMMAIALPEPQVKKMLDDSLWLALINGRNSCVVGGEVKAVEKLHETLKLRGVSVKILDVPHAFHTPLMVDAGKAVMRSLSHTQFASPKIPMTSNVTGRWLQDEMCNPEYWAEHLCNTVRWASNMDCLSAWNPDLIIEVGPGCTLGSIFERSSEDLENQNAKWFRSMRSAKSVVDDNVFFVELLADLWDEGCNMDFAALYESKQRAILPSYSFSKTSFWKNAKQSIYVEPSTCSDTHGACVDVACVPNNMPSCFVPIHKSTIAPDGPSYRMYCFAFAGGSWRAFQNWKTEQVCLHIIAVDPRNMGQNSDLKGNALTSFLANMISETSNPNERLIFCGLSFGALRAIDVYNNLPPWVQSRVEFFCVAGRSPPLHFDGGADMDLDQCSFVSPEVRESPEWKSFFLPQLMEDLEEDRFSQQRIASLLSERIDSVLTCDLMVCCGTDDALFLPSEAHLWSKLTSGSTSVELFQGDHSFLVNRSQQLFDRICKHISPKVTMPCDVVPNSYSIEWERLRPKRTRDKKDAPDFVYTAVSDALIDLTSAVEEKPTKRDFVSIVLVMGQGDIDKQAWTIIHLLKQIAKRDESAEIITISEANANGGLLAGITKSIQFEFPHILTRRILVENIHCISLLDGLQCNVLSPGHKAPSWVYKAICLLRETNECDLLLKITKDIRLAAYAPRLHTLNANGNLLAGNNELLGHRRPGGNYLITGGTGGIGSKLVDWLIAEQAVPPDKIVLLTRKTVSSKRGEHIIQIDRVDREWLMQCQDLASIGDVAGIFHLAGVVEDAIVPNTTFDSFLRVKQPKTTFLSSLLDLIVDLDWNPDFVCNFSSTSSLFGFPGQTSYCAANSYLDAQATNSADCPCPVITINWGPWAEVGMSKAGTKAYESAVKVGDNPLSNREAFAALSRIIRSVDTKQYAVCNVDWENSIWRSSTMISHIQGKSSNGSIQESMSADSVASPDPNDNSFKCDDAVNNFLGEHLPSWRPDETLVSLGVDSLDTVRMRSSFVKMFGCSAPLSLFMQHGMTVRGLADELRTLLSK